MSTNASLLPYERTRLLRYVDLATSETIDYLESPHSPANSNRIVQLHQLWREALDGPLSHSRFYQVGSPPLWLTFWTSDYEHVIDMLRTDAARFDAKKPE